MNLQRGRGFTVERFPMIRIASTQRRSTKSLWAVYSRRKSTAIQLTQNTPKLAQSNRVHVEGSRGAGRISSTSVEPTHALGRDLGLPVPLIPRRNSLLQ